MTTWEKYKAKLSSTRFHQLVIIGVFQIVKFYGWVDAIILDTLSGILLGSITIETADKIGKPEDPTIVNKEVKK
jgi:hypothetical protein